MRHRIIERRLMLDPPLSREALAHKVGIHPKTLAKIEQGKAQPRAGTRAKIAEALKWSTADLALALADFDPDVPLATYRAPTTGLDMLAMLEQSCRQLRTLELTICPGLLQVPRYAAAVESLDPDAPSPDEVARRVAERLKRQERALDKDGALHIFALLDPSILRSGVGGPSVMAEQVDHLGEMNRRSNVVVRLLSDAGRIAASSGPFKLLTGDDPDPFMVVTEDISTGLSYRGGPSVDAHHDLWRHLWSVSDALA